MLVARNCATLETFKISISPYTYKNGFIMPATRSLKIRHAI
jgi:hypothetical protein